MGDFLTEFQQDFSPAQRRALEDAAARSRDGQAVGDDELAAILASIKAGTEPLFKATTFGAELLDGCKLGTAFEMIRADLTAMLSQAQAVEATHVRHQALFDSITDRLHQSILRLDELVKINKTRRENSGYTDIKFNDFTAARNEATSPTRAAVDAEAGQLVAASLETNRYLTRGGDLKPTITATILSPGVNPESGKAFFPEDATDPRSTMAWAEILLADAELSGEYDSVSYDGAVIQLDIELPQPEKVNEIRLSSFGQHPLRLVRSSYFDGDTEINLQQTGTLQLDVTPLRFPTITTRRIRLIFNQVDYIRRTVLIDRGQVRRVGLLSLMSDRLFEETNDDGTMAFTLRDKRRAKAKVALTEALRVVDASKTVERHVRAIEDILDVAGDGLVRVNKFVYTAGLRVLEVNWSRRAALSDFVSPPMMATGSTFSLALATTEEHPQFDDGNGPENITSVEWEVDLGGGRIVPIVPLGQSIIRSEVMDFDATLVANSKFNQDAVLTVFEVRRDGELLSPMTDYLGSLAVPYTPLTVTLYPSAWRPGATYTITYDADPAQQVVNILDLYDSLKPVRPETFRQTGPQNRIVLQAHPFVLTEITNDRNHWSQPDPWDARWIYRGSPAQRSVSTDPPYVTLIDGEWYGEHPDSLVLSDQGAPPDVLAADTTIQIEIAGTMANAFPTRGVIELRNTTTGRIEQVYYDGVTPGGASDMTLNNCVRGFNNTVAADWDDTLTAVRYVTSEFYAPVLVRWNGTYCRNLTDYAHGRNPAFIDRDGPPQFVQVGNSLYFDRPLQGLIEVWYRRLADQLTVRAKLRVHHPLREYTPVVSDYALYLKTSTI